MSVSVSTHVLDTGAGRPASGVRVELCRGREVIASGETDADVLYLEVGDRTPGALDGPSSAGQP